MNVGGVGGFSQHLDSDESSDSSIGIPSTSTGKEWFEVAILDGF